MDSNQPAILAALSRMMRMAIGTVEADIVTVVGDTVLAWLEASGASPDSKTAASTGQAFVAAGLLVPLTEGVRLDRFNAGAKYRIMDAPSAPVRPSAVSARDSLGSFGLDMSRTGSRDSIADMVAGLQLGQSYSVHRGSAMVPALATLPEGQPSSHPASESRPKDESTPYRASTMAGALVSSTDFRKQLNLTVTIDATDTRTDSTNNGSSSAHQHSTGSSSGPYTVFGIRVAIGSGSAGQSPVMALIGSNEAAPPWTVWRRYRQFEMLHRALLRRVKLDRVLRDDSSKGAAEGAGAAGGGEAGSSEDGGGTYISGGGVFPELPGKGIGSAITSVLGGTGGVLSRSFVEARRVRLEEYLRGLVRCPAAWQGEELVLFLDNDTRSLASHLDYLRMIATQRLLTHVTISNAKRQRALDRKMSGQNYALESMARKIDRLEALLTESRERAARHSRDGGASGSMSRDLGRPSVSMEGGPATPTTRQSSSPVGIGRDGEGEAGARTSPESLQRASPTNDQPQPQSMLRLRPYDASEPQLSQVGLGHAHAAVPNGQRAGSAHGPGQGFGQAMPQGGPYQRQAQGHMQISEDYFPQQQMQQQQQQQQHHFGAGGRAGPFPRDRPHAPSRSAPPGALDSVAHAYVQTYYQQQHQQQVAAGQAPATAGQGPVDLSRFRNGSLRMAADCSPQEATELLDWLFGRSGDELNPCRPIDDSSHPSKDRAYPSRLSPEDLDRHRAAVMDRARAEAADLLGRAQAAGVVSSVSNEGSRGGGDRHRRPVPTTTSIARAASGSTGSVLSASVHWGEETAPMVPEWLGAGRADDDPLDARSPVRTEAVLRALAYQVDLLIANLSPTAAAQARRSDLIGFVASLVDGAAISKGSGQGQAQAQGGHQALWMGPSPAVAVTGSSATRLYLPDGDIDLTLLLAPLHNNAAFGKGGAAGDGAGHHMQVVTGTAGSVFLHPADSDWFVGVNESLCMAGRPVATPSCGGASSSRGGQSQGSSRSLQGEQDGRMMPAGLVAPPGPHAVRSVSFINAEVRLVRATVDACGVDISANGTQALAAACLVEAADRWIGRGHLFKRSVLLCKAWFQLESRDFAPSLGAADKTVLDSGSGGLSSHALTVLLLALFNSHARVIRHPLHALVLLFEEYADVTWGSTVLTVHGPRHMFMPPESCPDMARPAAPRFITASRLKPFKVFTASCAPKEALDLPLDVRNVNIADPVAQWNNLGRSVSRKGSLALTEALQAGRDRMRYILRQAKDAAAKGQPATRVVHALHAMFSHTISWYCRGDGYREDLLVHPLEQGGPQERAARLAAVPLPNTLSNPSTADRAAEVDVLQGDASSLNRCAAYASLLLAGDISAGLLVDSCKRLLAQHGPLPVGEIGKQLQERLRLPSLPAVLKDVYGGLKRLLEAHPRDFYIASHTHPFNPVVELAGAQQLTVATPQQAHGGGSSRT